MRRLRIYDREGRPGQAGIFSHVRGPLPIYIEGDVGYSRGCVGLNVGMSRGDVPLARIHPEARVLGTIGLSRQVFDETFDSSARWCLTFRRINS